MCAWVRPYNLLIFRSGFFFQLTKPAHVFRESNGCAIIYALTHFCQRLNQVQMTHPESLMVELGPEFCLIGSTPEYTRLWFVSEIDVNNSLKGLKSKFFRISRWQLELEEPGVKYFGNLNFSVKLTIWETAVNNHTFYLPKP